MLRRLHPHWYSLLGSAAALLVVSWLSVTGQSWPDWVAEGRPAAGLLLAGHFGRFLKRAPIEGSFLLRAPFMLATRLWHGGDASIFVAGAAPCLAASGVLAVWLVARMRERGASRLARGIALCVCVGSPLALNALDYGHPEELLGAVLCSASVVCAVRDRPGWAGVLLGLAIGNKAWGVLAVGPVLVALPRARLRTLLLSGAVAAVVLGPILLVSSSFALGQAKGAALTVGDVFQPWQVWWFFGGHAHAAGAASGARTAPGWLGGAGHLLVPAVAVPLTAWYARRGGTARSARATAGRRPTDPLLLLALLLLLRCVLDPWDISYYALPFLTALLSWEALTFPRAPVLTLAATVTGWFVFQATGADGLDLHLSLDAQAAAFNGVALLAVALLGVALYVPGARRRAVASVRSLAAEPVRC